MKPQIDDAAQTPASSTLEHASAADARDTMASTGSDGAVPVSKFDRWLTQRLLVAAGRPPLTVCLWDGKVAYQPNEPAVAGITIRDRKTLLKMLRSPSFEFGEGYASGRIEVTGDLVELCEAVYRTIPDSNNLSKAWRRLRMFGKTSQKASKRNIHHHYDLGNEFYQLWLDDEMLYTCAYFREPDMDLEAAQIAKMDHVCRKIRLHPGQSVVEAGCGWGGLALHMARKYGVRVRAYNISHEQIVYARERAQHEGLSDRIEFVEDDWRTISGQYDAFVSVGMLEHVGVENYQQLGDVIHRALRKEGLGLIHTIGRNVAVPLDPWIEQRIFPGACPPSLRQMMDIFEPWDYSVLDVENLRLHYAETLRHWLQRYLDHIGDFRDQFDETFIRTWRLYLAGSVASFTAGSLQLFQVVFSHAENNSIPWTRAPLYARADRPAAAAGGGMPEAVDGGGS